MMNPGQVGRQGGYWRRSSQASADALFDRWQTGANDTRKRVYNDLITSLKTDGIWPILDWFCILGGHASQPSLLNIKNPEKSLVIQGAPTFTADRGFTGDGAAAWLDFGEAFGKAGNQFSLDSHSFGCYVNQQSGTAGLMHSFGTASAGSITLPGHSAGNETFRACDAGADVNRVGAGRTGHRYASRTAAGVKRGFYNGVRTFDGTTASTALPGANGAVLRSVTNWSNDRVAACWSGGGMTDTQANALHTALLTALTAIGAN